MDFFLDYLAEYGYIYLCVGVPVLISLLFVISVRRKNERIRQTIASGQFIYYADFEKDWISAKSGKKGVAGYKYNDTPGCYVITIFSEPVTDDDFFNYENIYIGQSVNVCQRVHNHFNGKGKGDVYADIKYGKFAYVRIVPCKKEEMNKMEKDLIRAFNATASYNSTKGGGIRR